MAELTAVLDLLQQTAHLPEDLLVFCDSTYVINSITKWMPGWKRRGWKKGDGKPVLNVEIMKALDEAMTGRRVEFKWVKGHAGHELNEEADRVANSAAASWRSGRAPDAGPGFTGSRVSHPEAHPGQVLEEPDLFSDLEPAPSDEEQVVALERSLLTDAVRADRPSVAALLHPDWQEIGRSGRLWTREATLDAIGPIEPVGLEVVTVTRVAADAILLVWRALNGAGSTLRSSLWVRTTGGWQQRFHQGTPEA